MFSYIGCSSHEVYSYFAASPPTTPLTGTGSGQALSFTINKELSILCDHSIVAVDRRKPSNETIWFYKLGNDNHGFAFQDYAAVVKGIRGQ